MRRLCKCGRALIYALYLGEETGLHWVCELCRKSNWACDCDRLGLKWRDADGD